MASPDPRARSIFPGAALLFVGILLLLHNYGRLEIGRVFWHWWPLFLIFWGAIKLFERTAARTGEARVAPVTTGEVFLVFGLLSLIGIVVLVNRIPKSPEGPWPPFDTVDVDLGNIAPRSVPADAHITIRNGHGDIKIRASDDSQIRVGGKKNVRTWNERDAEHIASAMSVEIVPNGDGYEIHPVGRDSRVSLDLDISVPKKATLTIRGDKGDISVSDMNKPVVINTGNGDIEVRDTAGDVTIDTRKGDTKVSDTKGDVKVSGHGGEINVSNATGGLTVEGEFYGPIRADKIAKGVRFISQRTDLTLNQLSGHMEAGPGNLEIADAPGNLSLRTSDDVNIENASGKVKIDNRKGNVEVRFSFMPKEDVEISNSSASITLSIPGSSSFEILADCHSGDIDSEFSEDSLKKTSTESGDSHLEGKYGSGRGPKITLKTSYGSISLHKTSSDMPAPPPTPAPPRVRPAAPAPKTQKS